MGGGMKAKKSDVFFRYISCSTENYMYFAKLQLYLGQH